MSEPIRVLIVDDSVVVRRAVSDALAPDEGVHVIGTAANGAIALKKIEQLKPDVVILDIEMPVCDGFSVLRALRQKGERVWTIMFSTLTERGASQTIEALSLGAHDYVPKPSSTSGINGYREGLHQVAGDLIPKIKRFQKRHPQRGSLSSVAKNGAKPAPIRTTSVRRIVPTAKPHAVPLSAPVTSAKRLKMGRPPEILAIGISTGGPEALGKLLPQLPENFPIPIVIVQHMPPLFTKFLADRLNTNSKITVVEGAEGMKVEAGFAYIAQGGHHLLLKKAGTRVSLVLNQNEPENSCRPAADVLFRSVADVYGDRALGLIMTGMGQDGFKGLQVMKNKGATVMAQDEETSVVWGMPGAVVKGGLADVVLPLEALIAELERACCARAGRA